jgi:hypothetical protein
MTSGPECSIPGLLHNQDLEVQGLRKAAQRVSERLGHKVDSEEFGRCDYKDQAVTLAHLGERKVTVCQKHATAMLGLVDNAMDEKKTRPASRGYSASEMAGEFPDLRPWSRPPQQDGDRSSTWRTARLSAATINSLKGKQALRDGMFSLSYFTYGYHDNEGVRTACVYLRAIQAQLELPEDDSSGFLGWESQVEFCYAPFAGIRTTETG